ncbi:MAG: ferritin family protein [Bacteroidota bacterium]
MKEFKTTDDILDFAIMGEQEAIDFYTQLAEQSKNPGIRKVFLDYAEEEIRHKAKLMNIKENGSFTMESSKVMDLRITEYLVDVKPSPKMSYEEALIFAMKKEKKAFMLYMELANQAQDEQMKSVFLALAVEESKHKLSFEIEYDNYILKEN